MPVTASPSLVSIGEGFGGLEFWLRAHQTAHQQAAEATNTFLPILDPFDVQSEEAREGWLKDHARAHDEVNQYLKIAGSDLTELNWSNRREVQAWVDLNFLEHEQWGNLLK
jgi:hypothetical protein